MKKIITIAGLSALLVSCASSCVTSTSKSEKSGIDSVAFLRKKVDSLNIEIRELYDQLDAAQDELQMREGEISYWGHKYDSCMTVLKKRK